ncbi:MAG: NTPase [Candidatus Bathyarchaeia archaeon]
MQRKFFIIGSPGSGKSTVVLKVIEQLKLRRLTVGGIVTPELRVKGERVGFKVVDVFSGREEILASVDIQTGPRVGKYMVNVEGFESVALPALDYALTACDLICIDEVGRMEFFSEKFIQKVNEVIRSEKFLIATLHRNYVDSYRKFGTVMQVTPDNRDTIINRLISTILEKD